jgi:choline dehydrogenase-like flavoprotein
MHSDVPFGAGHIIGTYRMGSDPNTSVVDAEQRSHDHPNLYLLGSGVFPTTGTANPTLTIAALSLRAAETIRQELQR